MRRGRRAPCVGLTADAVESIQSCSVTTGLQTRIADTAVRERDFYYYSDCCFKRGASAKQVWQNHFTPAPKPAPKAPEASAKEPPVHLMTVLTFLPTAFRMSRCAPTLSKGLPMMWQLERETF